MCLGAGNGPWPVRTRYAIPEGLNKSSDGVVHVVVVSAPREDSIQPVRGWQACSINPAFHAGLFTFDPFGVGKAMPSAPSYGNGHISVPSTRHLLRGIFNQRTISILISNF